MPNYKQTESYMNKSDMTGKTLYLGVGSQSPIHVIIKEITDDSVVVQEDPNSYYSTNNREGRTIEFTIPEFERITTIKISRAVPSSNNAHGSNNKITPADIELMEQLLKLLIEDRNRVSERPCMSRESTLYASVLSDETLKATEEYSQLTKKILEVKRRLKELKPKNN